MDVRYHLGLALYDMIAAVEAGQYQLTHKTAQWAARTASYLTHNPARDPRW